MRQPIDLNELLPLPRSVGWAEGEMPVHDQPDRDALERWQALEAAIGQRVTRWKVVPRFESSDALERDPITGLLHDEGYRLRIDGGAAVVEATSPRGLRNALATLLQLQSLAPETLLRGPMAIEDAPRFGVRALIEGYYGPPWTDEQRYSMLTTMAACKFNAYFYAPKDDPYHRSRWNELYPDEKLSGLKDLVDRAGELCIDVWYAIGPGLTMQYSSTEDFAALVRKLEQVRSVGLNRFSLLFDDIPPRLQHDADRAGFDDLASAHAQVANRLFAELRAVDPKTRLVVCPTEYFGTGNEAYISRLGSQLNPLIEVFWTGPEICSRELTLDDASLLARTLHRPAIYWDNYPVNDLEMSREMHIGPYRGRDPHLYRASVGIVANGMQYPEATKLGLMTIGDYLWNPDSYEPERSWKNALRAVVGPGDAEAFFAFADCNRYSALYQTDAPTLADELGGAEFARALGRDEEAVAIIDSSVARLSAAHDLFARGMENAVLQAEITPWIDRFEKGIRLLEAFALFIKDREGAGRLLAERAVIYRQTESYVFADVLDAVCEEAKDAVR